MLSKDRSMKFRFWNFDEINGGKQVKMNIIGSPV